MARRRHRCLHLTLPAPAARRRAPHAAGVAALVGLALLAVLAGCGDDGGDEAEGYSDELRDQFVEDCTESGEDEPVCGCFYDALEARVPFERFQELDEQIGEGDEPIPDDIVDLAAACGADPSFVPTTSTAP